MGYELISTIKFLDVKVKVFYALEESSNSIICSWRARNPDSFYRGVVYLNNETGKLTYPVDAVIPEYVESDREILPQAVLISQNKLSRKLKQTIKKYMFRDYIRRNRHLIRHTHYR